MLITNIEYIPNREIVEHFGVVSGSTVRAKHMGRDMMAGLKNIFGGELHLGIYHKISLVAIVLQELWPKYLISKHSLTKQMRY